MTNGDIYDPNHPDADWSGFVSKRTNRKHIESEPDQLAPTKDGTSFGPKGDTSTNDWSKPARKIVGHRESGTTKAFAENDENTSSRSSTFSLIGGPIPVESPSDFSPKCWETEAQSAAMKRKTELEQLNHKGRSIHVRGKKRRTVLDENEGQSAFPSTSISQQSSNGFNDATALQDQKSNDPRDLIGFRSQFTSVTDPSFLREISEAVTSHLSNVIPPANSTVSTAPYATDANLPTDPYESSSGERRKDLLLENFSSVVPGYTGKRTFIN